MRPITAILIVIVIICTGFFAMFAKQLATEKREMVLDEHGDMVKAKEMVSVLIANMNLPAGTELGKRSVKWVQWPEDNIYPDLVTGGDEATIVDMIGMLTKRGFMKGEPIIQTKLFKKEDATFMAGMLNSGMRAVGIKIDTKDWGTGFIMPGDKVDIILAAKVNKPNSSDDEIDDDEPELVYKNASETIIRNVRVLAVDQDIADIDAEAKVVKTITLELSPKQAEALALAKEIGEVSLSLRSLHEDPNSSEHTRIPFTSDIELSAAMNAAINGGEAMYSTDTSAKRVKIYRGDQVSTQMVKETTE